MRNSHLFLYFLSFGQLSLVYSKGLINIFEFPLCLSINAHGKVTSTRRFSISNLTLASIIVCSADSCSDMAVLLRDLLHYTFIAIRTSICNCICRVVFIYQLPHPGNWFDCFMNSTKVLGITWIKFLHDVITGINQFLKVRNCFSTHVKKVFRI